MIAFSRGERVSVLHPATGTVPQSFTWRGQRHWVQAVEASKVSGRKQNSHITDQEIYQLRTVTGMRCTLTHDPEQGIWRLERIHNAGGQPWR
jgi:hypothetical protein